MNPGTTAIRTFAIDHTGLLYQTIDGTVPAMENGTGKNVATEKLR